MFDKSSHGLLAHQDGGMILPLQVLQTRAGFYIGTANKDGPVSRESSEYWQNQSDAEQALVQSTWTQLNYEI